ncbi:MAG: HindIII family type II restriction endonuclease [Sodaliphilus sp.]|nr:HindIII family type II restriction endonuclease [Sodaliphilus sp.]
MTFEELKIELSDCSSLSFLDATQRLQEMIFALDRANIIQLVSQIGAIPEDIGHDSTEEKLYAKVSDILLAKSLIEMNLEATVLTQRADCADVVAQSHYHRYSLVGDAKAFRLSRTARNAKDYKVNSMAIWKGDSEYAVLVCPYFQYPKSNSQIYKEALSGNIALFSWEYLYILLKEGIRESSSINLSALWNQSGIISKTTTVSNSKSCFLNQQNQNISKILKITPEKFYEYFNSVKDLIVERGNTEIQYYEQEIERVKQLNREEAIAELLRNLKLESKIATIRGFIDQINVRDLER